MLAKYAGLKIRKELAKLQTNLHFHSTFPQYILKYFYHSVPLHPTARRMYSAYTSIAGVEVTAFVRVLNSAVDKSIGNRYCESAFRELVRGRLQFLIKEKYDGMISLNAFFLLYFNNHRKNRIFVHTKRGFSWACYFYSFYSIVGRSRIYC